MNKFVVVTLIILLLGGGIYFFYNYLLEQKSSVPTCYDPDGLNYSSKSTTYNMKATDIEGFRNFTDVCTNEVDPKNSLYEPRGYLIEYNCNAPEGRGQIYECPNGCQDGVCK